MTLQITHSNAMTESPDALESDVKALSLALGIGRAEVLVILDEDAGRASQAEVVERARMTVYHRLWRQERQTPEQRTAMQMQVAVLNEACQRPRYRSVF